MTRLLAWLAALAVGIAVGVGTRLWLVEGPLFAGMLGAIYVIGTRLFVGYASDLPALETDGWRATQWNGAFAVLMSFIATLTLSLVPVGSFGVRVAVLLLVSGVGWTGLFFGVAMTQAKDGRGGAGTETLPRENASSQEYNPVGNEGSEV